MNATNHTKKVAAHQRSEARLPRKALLSVLDDRKTVVAIVQRRPYTMVSVTSWFNGKEYDGVGFSKVCYPDKWNDEDGADLALRRALIDILHQIRWDEDTACVAGRIDCLMEIRKTQESPDCFEARVLDEIPF